MPVDYGFREGVDIPEWLWLNFVPSINYHGCSSAYDGSRYIYWLVQYGTGGTHASTTAIWQYDTWSDGWAYLQNMPNGNHGMDIEYDPVANVLVVSMGAGQTLWYVYNLNNTAVTYANVSRAARSLSAAIAPALPAACQYGSTMGFQRDIAGAQAANGGELLSTGVVAAGSTATNVIATTPIFTHGDTTLYLRFTSGTLAGQRRLITARAAGGRSATTLAFTAAPAAGDTFAIELPEATATGATTTSVTVTGAGWKVNAYANSDVFIVAGTGAGQRRRIASNTADTLTLAAAYASPATNPRVGPFTTAPDTTSVFRIVPSTDFLYYQPGGTSTALFRIDIRMTGAAPTWAALATAPGGIHVGGGTFHRAMEIIAFRGSGTRNVYSYDTGTNTWTVLGDTGIVDTFSTGSSPGLMTGRHRLFIAKDNSQRTYIYDLATNMYQPAPAIPYANMAGYDGKRVRFVTTPEGVEWIYLIRAGGWEMWRIPFEWESD